MFCKATGTQPMKGDKRGTCCICHTYVQDGHAKQFKTNFTTTDHTSLGDVICKECKALIENSNILRRSMWILTEDEFRRFKKAEIKDILNDLPCEPFYLYLTRTYQKVGWVVLDGHINHPDNDTLRFAVDMDLYTTTHSRLLGFMGDAERLREDYGFSKTELRTGDVSLRKLKEIKEGGGDPREILTLINSLKGDPVWEVAVDMI